MRKKNPNFDRDKSDRRNDERSDAHKSSRPRRSNDGGDNRSKRDFGNKPKRSGRSFDDKNENRGERKSYARKSDDKLFERKGNSKISDKKPRAKRDFNESSDKKDFKKTGKREFDAAEKPFERKGKKFEPRDDKREFGNKSNSFKKNKFSTSEKEFGDDKRQKPNNKFGAKRGTDRRKPDFTKFRNKRKAQINESKDDGLIRLNKYVANAGICSRRQADEYIKTGLVEVNGTVITEMGHKVKADDDVRFDGQRISPEKKTYVLLNKPKGFITTTNDERDRKTVMDLVANASKTRLFPVGRLDRQTTGVLLFTNDGHMAKKLTHPSHNIKKIYHVVLDKNLHGDDMGKIRDGIRMEEGVAKVDKISFIDGKAHNEIGIEIHIGWNRVVRRVFEKLGYKVEHLDRVQFAGLTKKNVKRGDWRILDEKEVNFLKML